MASELKKVDAGIVEVSTKMENEELVKCEEKALKNLAKKVQVHGFRKGEAPIELAKSRISEYDLQNESINIAIQQMYENVLKENNLRPFLRPEVNVTKYEKSSVLEVTFKITVFPKVTLGTYKGIDIPLNKANVTSKDVDEAINKLLTDNAELVLKDTEAALGDTVVLDFKGYIDGKEFEGGSADNYSLVLGSNQFIPGFEEQLVGAKSETKVDVIVTFPEQYVKDLAGKEAKFVCKIHEIKTKKTPELNDDFASSLGYKDVKTVEELKKYEKEQLKTKKEQDVKNKHLEDVITKIVDESTIEIADAVLESQAEALKQNLVSNIEQNGITLEQYKEITGSTDESLKVQFKEQALEQLRHDLVLDEVARVENLRISERDLTNYYAETGKRFGMKPEEVKKYFEKNGQTQQLINELYFNKIHKFIDANNPVNSKEKEEKTEKKEETKEVKTPKSSKTKKDSSTKTVKKEKKTTTKKD